MKARPRARAASSTRARRSRAPQLTLAQARANRFTVRLGQLHAAGAALPRRAACSTTCRSTALTPLHRLDAVLQCLGIRAASSPTCSRTRSSARRRATCTRMRSRDAGAPIMREHWLTARARGRVFPVQRGRRRDRGVQRRLRARACCTACITCASRRPSRRASRTTRCRISSRRRIRARCDYIGAFAVTAGIGIEPHLERFEAAHDDYNDIMLKALADRLAEASPKRCTSACAASSGAMRRKSA